TGEESRLTVQMADESLLTLTAETKLTVDRSLPQVKIRDTVLQLFFGRVRSLVKKLAGEYTVKTPTVTVGVRGTDFALAVAPAPANKGPGWLKNMPPGLLTAVLTGGGESTVELTGYFGSSVTVRPLSVVGVRTGGLVEEGAYVGPAAEALLQRIAPLPATRSAQVNTFQPSLKPPAATAPCWPLSFKPAKELQFFRICE
ncbi:MAG: hypothetical protein D3906_16365, partial [Candidatus Electrothrix sp. AUS1_2]|nr:hypothetical protein [Candidatus Electrothrix sp. AUS1_2]